MMKYRCHTPTSSDYYKYGALGISVCERWLDSFEAFLEDMGERPDGYTLDRINVLGNYEPTNCRWADRKTQAGNRKPPTRAAKVNKTGFRGVVQYKPGLYRAQAGRLKSVHGLTSAEDAATVFNFMAFELWGYGSRLNTVPQPWLEETNAP